MIVMDVSAAACLVREGVSGHGCQRFLESADKTVAPDLFPIEAGQVAWKYARFGFLDSADADTLLRSMLGCVDEIVDSESLLAEALHEAIALNHPVYDMLYFVLARRTASPLLTCDRALAKLCEEHRVACIMVEEWTE